jgi:tripartite-type tricarboxylate transporter receptor subunit TctC
MIVIRMFFTLAFFVSANALAQAFPSQPIKVIVPYPPGGVVDVIARLVGDRMSKNIGQPVVVENRTGAASNIGTEFVARAPADGYTLVLASPAHTVNVSLYSNLRWHPVKSFAPIVMVGVIPSVIVVHPSVPVKSLAELVTYVKARPGKLNYSSAGPGSSIHLAAEMLKQMADLYVLHIPYRGQPEALTALLTGDVQMMFLTMALAKPRADAGTLKPLAVTTPKRSAVMPDIPTVAESGYPGFEVSTWFAYLAPAGTPPDVVAKLNAEITAAMRDPEVLKRLQGIGAELNPGSPQDLQRFLEADIERWAKVVNQADIKVE